MRYINTKVNPADILSRGCSAKALNRSELWKFGPNLNEISFVDTQMVDIENGDVEEVLVEKIEVEPVIPLIDLTNITNYLHAHNIKAKILKFCHISKSPLEMLVFKEQ